MEFGTTGEFSARSRNRARRRWKATGCTGAVLLLWTAPAAAADEPAEEGACPVIASAQGVQVMVSKSDDLFLTAPFGAGLPVAQSCVDYQVRDSSSFASAPYPGQPVISASPMLRGMTSLPIPDYPLYAQSRYPSAKKSAVSEQGYSLSARSDESSSESEARSQAGQDAGSAGSTAASAVARVDPEAKASDATAKSVTLPVTINDVLELGHVHSVATAKVADGKLVRSSQLRVGHTTVAGQEVVITPEGVQAAGETVALPDGDPAEALAAAGVSVRYLKEVKTTRGVLSAGIEVLARQQDPATGAGYDLHYTFGRAFAAAAEVDERSGGALPPGDIPAGVPASGPADSGQPVTGDAASGPIPGGEAPTPGELPDVAKVPGPQAAPEQVRLTGGPVEMGMAGLYLVIVFGALAMFASGMLLRLLGVRTRWTS